MGRGEGKIRFPFVALPKYLCTPDFFRSPHLFIFLCWIFNRISFEKKTIQVNAQVLDLEPGEFIFGRVICSDDTGISVQSIRTIVKSLHAKRMLKKVTSKSTNKFTVYALVWDCFLESVNHRFDHQINQQVTINQPSANHNQEEENKNKESSSNRYCFFTDMGDDAKDMLAALPTDEQKAIIALFQKRTKEKAIAKPACWIVNCIKKKWHHEKRDTLSSPSDPHHAEVNRKLAKEVQEK